MAKKKDNFEEVLARLDDIEEKLDELDLCNVPKGSESGQKIKEETNKGWEEKLDKLV